MKRLFVWLHALLLLPVLMLLVLVALLRVGIHSHPMYHQQVEAWLQASLQQSVALDDFTLQLDASDLAIDISGAKLGADKLDLQHLSFSLDLRSLLLKQQLKLSGVQLFGLDIALQEQADGSWQPQGLAAVGNAEGAPSAVALLALLQQAGSLALGDAQITLSPRTGKSISIHNVSALVTPYGNMGVALNLHANYPQTQGKLAAVANIRFTDTLSIAQAKAQVQLQQLPLDLLWQQLRITQVEDGLLSANLSVQVEDEKLQAVQVRDLQLATQYQNLALDWRSDVDLLRQAEHWHLQVANVSGDIGGWHWPIGDLSASFSAQHLQVSSTVLQLQPMTSILQRLPDLPAKVTAPIIGLAPQGEAYAPRFTWYPAQPKDFLFTSSLDKVSIATWKGVPAVTGADGNIAINAKGGKVSIDDSNGLQVHLPKLTTQAWQFDSMVGEVGWGINSQTSQLFSSIVQLTQDQASLNLLLAGEFPRSRADNVADKEASFSLRLGMQNMDVANIPALLPNVTMGNNLGDYLANAAKAGRIAQGGVTFNGLLGPKAKSLGTYAYSVPVWGKAKLPKVNYAAGWPALYKADLDFASNHQAVSIDLHRGQLLASAEVGLSMANWQVSVPMLTSLHRAEKAAAMIAVSGALQGDGKLFQKLAKQLPVTIPEWIMDLNPGGDMTLHGDIRVPYGAKAKGRPPTYSLKLNGDKVSGFWPAQQVALRDVALATTITEQGIVSLSAIGLADGHPVNLGLSAAPDPATRQGQLPTSVWQSYGVEQLNKGENANWLHLQGQVPRAYAMQKLGLATLDLHDWLPENPAIDMQLPACFMTHKDCQLAVGHIALTPADVNWPAVISPAEKVYWAWRKQPDGNQALYIKSANDHLALNIEQGQLKGLGIGLGTAAAEVALGTHIQGKMTELDAAYWLAYLQTDNKTGSEGGSGLTLPSLQRLEIQSQRLLWQDLQLHGALLTYDVVDQGWALGLLSEEVTGHVFNAGGDAPWLVDIDQIRIQRPQEVDSDEALEKPDLLAAIDPSIFPDMDIELHDLVKNDQSYGHWQLKARNADGKVYLHDIEAKMHSSHLSGNMIWSKQGGEHETAFSGRILSNDVAETLSGWGYSPTISSAYGALEVQLSWPASPLAFDIEASTGDLALRVKQGEFSQSPGVAGTLKVLSLLDVGRLLQRVRLDFTDVLSEEYQFDSINAYYQIADGVARTANPASFKSSSLELSLDGSINFHDRTLDNDLYVTLPVSGKLSFAALLAGLPQLSGVLYVVDKLVGDELATFTSARYGVTGDLDKPDVAMRQMFDANKESKSLDERVNNVFKIQ